MFFNAKNFLLFKICRITSLNYYNPADKVRLGVERIQILLWILVGGCEGVEAGSGLLARGEGVEAGCGLLARGERVEAGSHLNLKDENGDGTEEALLKGSAHLSSLE